MLSHIRSTVYFMFMTITSLFWGIAGVLTWPFSIKTRFAIISTWAKMNIWALRWMVGLSYEVEGVENIPEETSLIVAKHQSTWETMAFQCIFPQQTWVLKKELLSIPGFGWGLSMLRPVAIDRKAKKKAMEQVIEQGIDRMNQGLWIVIFPEGTRTAPGSKNKYALGGARLAIASERLIVPVAHNAGEYWPRHGFLKKPGIIKVVIGKPISAMGKKPEEIMSEAKAFIEGQMDRISTV